MPTQPPTQFQEEYRVRLDAFQGPLDLLLYLIRRAEVDINDIPVAEIAEQYLGLLRQVDAIDVELAGEFLVMAATLIELKSRTLMPPGADDGEGGEASIGGGVPGAADPRMELVQQLLAYQRFRMASEALDDRRLEFAHRFALRPARGDEPEADAYEPPELELDDAHVMDLADAYERIMASIDFTRLGDHVVEMDDTPIALYQEDLLDRLGRATEHRLSLQDTFRGVGPSQRVGLFLATLELARLRRVTVIQEDLDREIEVVLVGDSDEATERRSDEGVASASP
ncbi:MAG: segregation/condensation protein A [Planctomycetes bacterium]|nr:segregation/condensation protein A [Planctomycetota bacterium]